MELSKRERAELEEKVQRLAKQVNEDMTKQFIVSQLVSAFNTAEDSYRYDLVIRHMGGIFEDISKDDPHKIVTAEEISVFYNHLISLQPESKFKEVFGHLLPSDPNTIEESIAIENREFLADSMRDVYTNDTVRELVASENAPETIEVDQYEDIAPQRIPLPEELRPVEALLEDAVLESAVPLKKEVLDEAKAVVRTQMEQIGCHNLYIRTVGYEQPHVHFDVEASINERKYMLNVPIEVQGSIVLLPTTFKCGNEDYRFTKADFNSLSENENNGEAIRYDGQFLDMSYNDLRKQMHKSAIDKNYATAQECLNAIQDKFGFEALKNASADFQYYLKEGSVNYSQRCTGCVHYEEGNDKSIYASDYCGLLSSPCNRVVMASGSIATKDNICVKSSISWDTKHDDQYEGVISTSQIALT